jgi:hypothetical protein
MTIGQDSLLTAERFLADETVRLQPRNEIIDRALAVSNRCGWRSYGCPAWPDDFQPVNADPARHIQPGTCR